MRSNEDTLVESFRNALEDFVDGKVKSDRVLDCCLNIYRIQPDLSTIALELEEIVDIERPKWFEQFEPDTQELVELS